MHARMKRGAAAIGRLFKDASYVMDTHTANRLGCIENKYLRDGGYKQRM